MKVEKSYSVLDIKSVDEERRIIEGIATTPSTDRVGDVVVTDGIEFKLPLPLLYQHNSRQPIGNVVEAWVEKKGIRVRAKIAEAGVMPWIDEAWQLVKHGLVRGLSIGFRSIESDPVNPKDPWGPLKFLRTEWLELSAVTIPANAEATITAVKSACESTPAASGNRDRSIVRLGLTSTPGVSGFSETKTMKTIGEQIAAFEAKRAAHAARMTQIMERAGDQGRTLDETETEEYDGLQSDLKTIDDHLARLRAHEREVIPAEVRTAVPVTEKTAGNGDRAGRAREGYLSVKGPDLPKGIGFARYTMAVAAARGNMMEAHQIAKRWRDTTPEVERVLRSCSERGIGSLESIFQKVATDVGDTTTSGWASQLADFTYLASEFIEFLRPQTIIGRIGVGPAGLRRVPFNIKMPLQTHTFGSFNWVAEGGTKPVGRLTFDTATLRWAKSAGIVVLTDELVRFSNPAAEALVRDDLAEGMARFLDRQFVDPTVAAVVNERPASITNGAANHSASGNTAADFRNDLQRALRTLINADIPLDNVTLLMQPIQALSLSLLRNALSSQKEFPELTVRGGSAEGFPVVTSNSVAEGLVVVFNPREIYLADDGGVNIDASREATVLMDDGVSPATETTVSLWQQNLIAIRAERYINWQRRRLAAVHYIDGANYGGALSP